MEYVQADDDYETDDSDVVSLNEDNFDNSDNFDDLEMMQIEMTFSGGKRDTIVVRWGDESLDLAKVLIFSFSLLLISVL